MSSNTQAQKGFKTFILTLVISLIVFSAIYYIVNTDSNSTQSSGPSVVSEASVPEARSDEIKSATLGDKSSRQLAVATDSDKAAAKNNRTSVFEELATSDMNVATKQVLADEIAVVQETTVPDTGIMSPTVGILFSIIALVMFSYLMFVGPRKIALTSFEKDVLEDIEKN